MVDAGPNKFWFYRWSSDRPTLEGRISRQKEVLKFVDAIFRVLFYKKATVTFEVLIYIVGPEPFWTKNYFFLRIEGVRVTPTRMPSGESRRVTV